MRTNRKDVSYYVNLPHKIEITPEEDGTGFTAVIPAFKGCTAFGETIEETYQAIIEVKEAWVEIALERGWRIPEPTIEELKEYSGRFNVRLPRYLHRALAELAEEEGTSLNQLVVACLSEAMGRRCPRHRSAQHMPRFIMTGLIESPSQRYAQLIEHGMATLGKGGKGTKGQWFHSITQCRVQVEQAAKDIDICD